MAGVVAMVPEGLVLLTSVAFALGVVRLARRRTLVQELSSVETLARVDVICLDKTGTITHGDLAVTEFRPVACEEDARAALGAVAAADESPNATLLAVRNTFSAEEGWQFTKAIPFSSPRKWSGATFEGRGSWVLGAPDVLLGLSESTVQTDTLRRQVELAATSGSRVLLLGFDADPLDEGAAPSIEPRALVLLSDRVRADAPETLRYFAEQNVAVKIISGDIPIP